MTGCESCAKADETGIPGFLDRACLDCAARSLANGPLYFESARDGKPSDEYKAALVRVFGADWKRGHQRVRECAAIARVRQKAQ